MMLLVIIALLSLLILAHELGHLISAKLSGVKVEEFGLGFPPRLLSFHWRETRYSLNLLPLGGFVRLLGEDEPKGPRSLAAKSAGVRLVVLSSGALMNIILPLFLFTASFMIPRQVSVGEVLIQEVRPGSPAELAGLLAGDRVVEVNGRALRNHYDLIYNVLLNLGKPVKLAVQRDSAMVEMSLVPRLKPPPGEGAIGVVVGTVNLRPVSVSLPPWPAFLQAGRTVVETFTLLRNEIISWVVRRQTPQVGGPVAIVQLAGEAARAGPSPLLSFTAFISINLAIINLLPLPALDGGRLVFVVLEILRRGRRISPQRERLVHLIGFLMLIALIFLISYYDLRRIIVGEGLLP